MSSLSEIMSQQMVEELHEKEGEEGLTEDERLAREMQQVFDAEHAEIEEEARSGAEGEKEGEKKEGEMKKEGEEKVEGGEGEGEEEGEGKKEGEGEEDGVVEGEELTEDELLARQMQQDYDAEFAASFAEEEKQSLKRRGLGEEEGEEDLESIVDFDYSGTPLYHSNRDENGDIITKHNPVLCGMKNANKIGLFVDGAGDMDGTVVENSAYNALKKKSFQSEKEEKKKSKRHG